MIQDPHKLMAILRTLDDRSLAQYAALHKKDPYIFPLAFQESTLRKQMRAGNAGAQPPAPPVVDQALASMQPSMVGLPQIAPQDVARMAGGGLASVAGGEEEYVPSNKGLAPTFYRLLSAPFRGLSALVAPLRGEEEVAPALPPRPDENYSHEGRNFVPSKGLPALTAKPAPAKDTAGAGVTASATLRARGGPELARTPPGKAPDIYNPEAALDRMSAKPTVDPFAKDTREIVDASNAAAKTQLEGRQSIADDQAKLFNRQEGRLAAREEGLSKDAKRNEAMAFINAGLQMLQAKGPGLAGIAAGAQSGFAQYGAGLERLKEAQAKIDDARMQLDEARLGSRKDMLTAQGAYDAALLAGRREVLKGVQDAYGKNAQDARKLVELATQQNMSERQLHSQQTIAHNNNATQLAIARLDAESKMAAARLAASGRGQIDIAKEYSDYLQRFDPKPDGMGRPTVQRLTPQEFASALSLAVQQFQSMQSGAGVVTTAPAAAGVLPRR